MLWVSRPNKHKLGQAGVQLQPKAMFKIFALLAAAATVFASEVSEANKVEEGRPCNTCNSPCPGRCPNDLALSAAQLLVENFCNIINTRDLPTIQGGLLGFPSTIQYNWMPQAVCVDSGVVPFMNGIITAMPQIICVATPTITSSYVDAKGRVIVFADNLFAFVINGESPASTIRSRYVFEPVCGTCQFRLVDLTMVDSLC